ncbi:hypothetical protein [Streptomyces marianii]|uniref:Uncharacterized protein n=1 Tax=Streptomyces marianii TaxID=1817406 RepID=A0A5R9E7M9_9ACTN|nr:hypothetical protein [Streptomyces marianii]TLQ44244.1 hypothetical protein FEF34_14925 [Streptomyces marianii]
MPRLRLPAVAPGHGDDGQAGGFSRQLLLNLVGIVLAGTLTLLVQKRPWTRRRRAMSKPAGA